MYIIIETEPPFKSHDEKQATNLDTAARGMRMSGESIIQNTIHGCKITEQMAHTESII